MVDPALRLRSCCISIVILGVCEQLGDIIQGLGLSSSILTIYLAKGSHPCIIRYQNKKFLHLSEHQIHPSYVSFI